MPTFNNTSELVAYLFFNQVIALFGVLDAIAKDHGNNFHSNMMVELTTKLGLSHESSTPYYPRANG